MLKKILIALLAIVILVVIADYFRLFGVENEYLGDYIHVTFQFVDAQSGAPISDVHVSCTRPGVRSACTESLGPGAGQTTITLSVFRRTEVSWFFSGPPSYVLGDDTVMFLTFFAANHERAQMTIHNDDPLLSATRPHKVELAAAEQ